MKEDSVRLQMDLSAQRIIEINALLSKLGLGSKKDLMNNALDLFQWAVQEVEAGRVIASVDKKNKRFKEVVLPVFEKLATTRHNT